MGKERGLDLPGCNNLVTKKAIFSNQKGKFPAPDTSSEPELFANPLPPNFFFGRTLTVCVPLPIHQYQPVLGHHLFPLQDCFISSSPPSPITIANIVSVRDPVFSAMAPDMQCVWQFECLQEESPPCSLQLRLNRFQNSLPPFTEQTIKNVPSIPTKIHPE